MVQMRKTFKQA